MRIILSILILTFSLPGFSQEHRSKLRQGNNAYKQGNFSEAEKLYEESFEKDVSYNKAEFNSGNAKYKKNDFIEAGNTFGLQAEKLEGRNEKAAAYHNQGNSMLGSYLMAKQLSEGQQNPDTLQMLQDAAMGALKQSEAAYKNALRNNSTDDETRYNYALVKKLLEQEMSQSDQGGGDQGDQDKEDEGKQQEQEQDQNQEKSDQEQQQNNGEEQESDSKQEDEQDQKGDKEEGDKEGENSDSAPKTLSKKEAEQILEALKNKEQMLHQEMKKKKKPSKAIKIEKDW